MLFVCHGNICRSPYAAARFERLLPPPWNGRVRVASAGFIGPDRSAPELARRAAESRAIELNGHRSQVLTPQLLQEWDLVLVMEPSQGRALRRAFRRSAGVIALGDLDPLPIRTRRIIDPIEGDAALFTETYERIDRCVAELVKLLGMSTHSAQ
ncbi:MAG: hypothetical protein ACRELD_01080 [Longimicrobiales bacterium]